MVQMNRQALILFGPIFQARLPTALETAAQLQPARVPDAGADGAGIPLAQRGHRGIGRGIRGHRLPVSQDRVSSALLVYQVR